MARTRFPGPWDPRSPRVQVAARNAPSPPRRGRRRIVWLLVLAFWTGLALLEGVQYYFVRSLGASPITLARALEVSLPRWWLWALLTPGIVLVARRFPLEREVLVRRLGTHVPVALAFTAAYLGVGGVLYHAFVYRPAATLLEFFPSFLAVQLPMAFLMYWAILGGWHAVDYHRRFRDREMQAMRLALEASRLEAGLTQARLRALSMQLQPHFLFNTLHAVSTLVLKGERESAVRMLTLLGDLLRLSLEGGSAGDVTLKEELDFLDRFLAIERVRFGDRLIVEMCIEPGTLDARVPRLILQPLVENAMRHGIAALSGPGTVRIAAERAEGRLRLSVLDSGPGLARNASEIEEGVGFTNTRRRLETLFGPEHVFRIEDGPLGGTLVTVAFPFREGDLGDSGRRDRPAVVAEGPSGVGSRQHGHPRATSGARHGRPPGPDGMIRW